MEKAKIEELLKKHNLEGKFSWKPETLLKDLEDYCKSLIPKISASEVIGPDFIDSAKNAIQEYQKAVDIILRNKADIPEDAIRSFELVVTFRLLAARKIIIAAYGSQYNDLLIVPSLR